MQRTQLAAALVAALGFALHGTAFAADAEKTTTVKSEKSSVKVAEKKDATEKGKEGACKGKEGSCKGKEGSCKTKETKETTKKVTKSHHGHKKETKVEEKKEETK